jgi:hypothetical protein
MSRLFKMHLVVFVFLFSGFLFSADWYVNDNSLAGDIYTSAVGNNTNPGTSGAPFLTLQYAINSAAPGDVIYIDAGTYTGAGNRDVNFDKEITVIGAGTGSTIFTSFTNHRFGLISSNNVRIQNLQIFNYFLEGSGQALFVNTNIVGFELNNIVMKKNLGANSGGESIRLSSGSSSTFDGLVFSCSGFNGNAGGAIKVDNATLVVSNSIFYQSRDNSGSGGAIGIFGTNPHVTVDNTTFDSNIAQAGGAISQSTGTLIVTNSCFNRNYINGDSGSNINGGGHYYSRGNDNSLVASFTNCSFTGAFFCATTNPAGYLCEFSSNVSNDGNAISLRQTAGTFTFDRCLFDNSNQPQANFDNGLDFYLHKAVGATMSVTINNSQFGNDMFGGVGSGGSDAVNIWNENLSNVEFIVNDSGVKQTTANQDGVLGNNYSYSGTAPGGNDDIQTLVTDVTCQTGISSCSIAVDCATETNPPIIVVCAPDQTITDCSGDLPDYRPLLSVYDDCSFTIAQSPAPGTLLSTLGNGVHTITFTVSDESPASPDAVCTMELTLSNCVACVDPGEPTGDAAQFFCSIDAPTVADLVALGDNIQWYDAAVAGNLLNNADLLIDGGVYYSSQTVGSCESATRLEVTVTVNDPSAPTGNATQIFCSIDSPTVAELSATGTSIQWYSTSTGGVAITPTTAL